MARTESFNVKNVQKTKDTYEVAQASLLLEHGSLGTLTATRGACASTSNEQATRKGVHGKADWKRNKKKNKKKINNTHTHEDDAALRLGEAVNATLDLVHEGLGGDLDEEIELVGSSRGHFCEYE